MDFALVKDGKFSNEIPPNLMVTGADGIAVAWSVILAEDATKRAKRGVYPIVETKPEADKLVGFLSGPAYQFDGLAVQKVWSVTPHQFGDAGTQTWVRDAAWAEVKAWREARKFDPFQHAGSWFDGDLESQRLVNGAVTMALAAVATNTPYANEWGAADDTKLVVDAAGMIALGMSVGQKTHALWSDADAAWTAIGAATSGQACRNVVNAFKAAHPETILVRRGNPAPAAGPFKVIINLTA